MAQRIWYATFGVGPPVILLHSGEASSDIWGRQVPALVADHHRVIVIDARGHGRSSWDGRIGYELMARDVIAVMDAAGIDKADVVGWSDGAIVSLIMAMKHPERVGRVFAFGANMDVVGGLNPLGALAPVSRSAEALLRAEYARDTGSAQRFRPACGGRHVDAADDAQLPGRQGSPRSAGRRSRSSTATMTN